MNSRPKLKSYLDLLKEKAEIDTFVKTPFDKIIFQIDRAMMKLVTALEARMFDAQAETFMGKVTGGLTAFATWIQNRLIFDAVFFALVFWFGQLHLIANWATKFLDLIPSFTIPSVEIGSYTTWSIYVPAEFFGDVISIVIHGSISTIDWLLYVWALRVLVHYVSRVFLRSIRILCHAAEQYLTLRRYEAIIREIIMARETILEWLIDLRDFGKAEESGEDAWPLWMSLVTSTMVVVGVLEGGMKTTYAWLHIGGIITTFINAVEKIRSWYRNKRMMPTLFESFVPEKFPFPGLGFVKKFIPCTSEQAANSSGFLSKSPYMPPGKWKSVGRELLETEEEQTLLGPRADFHREAVRQLQTLTDISDSVDENKIRMSLSAAVISRMAAEYNMTVPKMQETLQKLLWFIGRGQYSIYSGTIQLKTGPHRLEKRMNELATILQLCFKPEVMCDVHIEDWRSILCYLNGEVLSGPGIRFLTFVSEMVFVQHPSIAWGLWQRMLANTLANHTELTKLQTNRCYRTMMYALARVIWRGRGVWPMTETNCSKFTFWVTQTKKFCNKELPVTVYLSFLNATMSKEPGRAQAGHDLVGLRSAERLSKGMIYTMVTTIATLLIGVSTFFVYKRFKGGKNTRVIGEPVLPVTGGIPVEERIKTKFDIDKYNSDKAQARLFEQEEKERKQRAYNKFKDDHEAQDMIALEDEYDIDNGTTKFKGKKLRSIAPDDQSAVGHIARHKGTDAKYNWHTKEFIYEPNPKGKERETESADYKELDVYKQPIPDDISDADFIRVQRMRAYEIMKKFHLRPAAFERIYKGIIICDENDKLSDVLNSLTKQTVDREKRKVAESKILEQKEKRKQAKQARKEDQIGGPSTQTGTQPQKKKEQKNKSAKTEECQAANIPLRDTLDKYATCFIKFYVDNVHTHNGFVTQSMTWHGASGVGVVTGLHGLRNVTSLAYYCPGERTWKIASFTFDMDNIVEQNRIGDVLNDAILYFIPLTNAKVLPRGSIVEIPQNDVFTMTVFGYYQDKIFECQGTVSFNKADKYWDHDATTYPGVCGSMYVDNRTGKIFSHHHIGDRIRKKNSGPLYAPSFLRSLN